MRLAGALLAVALAGGALLPAVDTVDELVPAAVASTDKGLAWLAATQQADGSWRGEGSFVGVTACCALALMAHGNVPGSGQYGNNTARALQYLLRYSAPDGLIFRKNTGPSPMYHHGLATLALAEAWGQTGDKRLRDALKKAVDLICATQNGKGGWRYQPKIADDDLSVTVMQLMALRAAKDAGMAVPKEVIDAGIAYVKACHNGKGAGKDGGFAYTPGGGSGWARTGAGITSLQVAGNYKANEVSEGVEYLLTFQPVGEKKVDDWWDYGSYYSTMGMYQAQSLGAWGKKAWTQFYPAMTKAVIARQKPEGHWDGPQAPYPTAMALLVLEIPCRYLPIYQR
jgi:hypothetical protein